MRLTAGVGRRGRSLLAGALALTLAAGCGSSPAPSSSAAAPGAGPTASSSGGLSADELAVRSNPTLERLATDAHAFDTAVDAAIGIGSAIGAPTVEWLSERRSDSNVAALKAGGVDIATVLPPRLATGPLAAGTAVAPVSLAWVSGLVGAPLMLSVATGRIGESIDSSGEPTTSHDETTQNGLKTVADTTTTSKITVSGSTVTVDYTSTQTSTTTDATGVVVGTSSHTMHVVGQVEACPNASGVATLHLTVDMQASGTGSGAGSFSSHATYQEDGQVGDDAWLASTSNSETMDFTSTGASGTQQSGTGSRSWTLGQQSNGGGSSTVSNFQDTSSNGTMSQTDANGWRTLMRITIATVSSLAMKDAQAQWRAGKCIRIESTEPGREVNRNEVVHFTATVFHKIEGTQLDKPVMASLGGTKALDPAGAEQPSPARLTFTAGANEGDQGVVSLKSTSNRGIGTLDVTFHVGNPWVLELEIDSKITITKYNNFAVAKGLAKVFGRIRLQRNDDGSWSGKGSLTSTTTSDSAGCSTVHMTGSGTYDWVISKLVASQGIAPGDIELNMDAGPISEQPDSFTVAICKSTTLSGPLNTWENLFFIIHNADFGRQGFLVKGWTAGSGLNHWGQGFDIASTTWTGVCPPEKFTGLTLTACTEKTTFRLHSVAGP